MVKGQPDISVAVICYNQEKFIEQTLNGVNIQNFSGTMEIVVGDDQSTDGTRERIRSFAENRDNVRLLFHERNLGMVGNWIATIDACKGRYIALCEGDDYWTDPSKLQRQFDLMEELPEHSQCWHPVDVVVEGVQRPYPYAQSVEIADTEDIIKSHFIPTCSLFFRNGLIKTWPKWVDQVMSMDITLELLLSLYGTALRINEIMGAYRQHPGGISKTSKHSQLSQLRLVEMLRAFNEYSNFKQENVIKSRIAEITRLQLKVPKNRQFNSIVLLLKFFVQHLYAVNAHSLRAIRHEAYLHLFPNLYKRIKTVF